jgi:hypothetical protein
MLTVFFISANAEERSKQDGQLRTSYGTKVGSGDGKTQGAGLSAITRSCKTLK